MLSVKYGFCLMPVFPLTSVAFHPEPPGFVVALWSSVFCSFHPVISVLFKNTESILFGVSSVAFSPSVPSDR